MASRSCRRGTVIEAVALAASRQPAVAVLDVGMPGLDGLEVLAAIRGIDSLKGTRVLLLTAKAQESDVRRGYEAGADAYVKKPFSPAELAARVRELLRLGRPLNRWGVAVAEAAHGLDRHESGAAGIELAPEVADVELHLVAADAERVAPDELEQLVAREHLPRMADEGREEPELERRQLHLPVGDRDPGLRPVDRQVAVASRSPPPARGRRAARGGGAP